MRRSTRLLLTAGILLLIVLAAATLWWRYTKNNRESALYYDPPARTKTSGCVIKHALPDPGCTPGAVDKSATVEIICGRSTKEVRNTSRSIDKATFAAYGVSRNDGVKRENDHLISLELGGADNDIANHFPQPYEDSEKLIRGELSDNELGAHAKDKVENWFHQRLCDQKNKVPRPGARELLPVLQKQMAVNWVLAYREYLQRPRARKARSR